MKHCSGCDRDLPLGAFSRKGNGLQSTCQECNRAYQRKHYRANSGTYKATAKAARSEAWERLRALKDAPCVDCKRSYHFACMDFDHRPGEVKIAEVSTLMNARRYREAFEEIARCDLVCSNCHRIRTWTRLTTAGSNPVGGAMKMNLEIRAGEGGDDASRFAWELADAIEA